jgi:S1-C subfamily serine protease
LGATKVGFKVGIPLDTISGPGRPTFRGRFIWQDAATVEVDEIHDRIAKAFSESLRTKRSHLKRSHGSDRVRVFWFLVTPPGADFRNTKGHGCEGILSMVEVQVPGDPPGFRRSTVLDSILLDAVVNPGNSGGPVYDS